MPVTIKLRRDTAANWTSANPTLDEGEPGLETDTGKIKFGDGSTAWNSLAYYAPLPGAHKTSHQSGGSDAIKLDDLAATDDNTDLNASASAHGLCPKLSGNSAQALRGDGTWGATTPASHAHAIADVTYLSGALGWGRQAGTARFERWFTSGQISAAAFGSYTHPSDSSLMVTPLIVTRACTLDRIRIMVTTAGDPGAKARLGIYNQVADNDLYPNALLVDGGELDITSTGVKEATISLALNPGTYYCAITINESIPVHIIRGIPVGGQNPHWGSPAATGTASHGVLHVTQAYGALPSTFPSGGLPTTATQTPVMQVRLSA
jgi:hypothetical protein